MMQWECFFFISLFTTNTESSSDSTIRSLQVNKVCGVYYSIVPCLCLHLSVARGGASSSQGLFEGLTHRGIETKSHASLFIAI